MGQPVARFIVVVAVSMLLSCATIVRDEEGAKQCSDTPHNAVVRWFRGVAEFSVGMLRGLIPDGATIFGVFGEGERGQEVVRQIMAHPVSGANEGCACTPLSTTDDSSDPRIKIVTVKRVLYVEDDRHEYKRAFRVTFDPRGNCITNIESVQPKWERIPS